MRENTDQKNSEYGHILRSVKKLKMFSTMFLRRLISIEVLLDFVRSCGLITSKVIYSILSARSCIISIFFNDFEELKCQTRG